MKYVSDDGKVFNTEQECLEHENIEKRRLEEEWIAKEKRRKEQKDAENSIKQHHNDLMKEIETYRKKYNKYNSEIYSKFGLGLFPVEKIIETLFS